MGQRVSVWIWNYKLVKGSKCGGHGAVLGVTAWCPASEAAMVDGRNGSRPYGSGNTSQG